MQFWTHFMQKEERMRAYFINSETDEHEAIDIEPTLEEYYRLIGCRCVDFIMRDIDDTPYNIILDDEGLLKPNRVTAVSVHSDIWGNQEHLAGNLLIFGVDPDDFEHGCKSLTDNELLQIQCRMIDGIFADGSEHPVLFYSR